MKSVEVGSSTQENGGIVMMRIKQVMAAAALCVLAAACEGIGFYDPSTHHVVPKVPTSARAALGGTSPAPTVVAQRPAQPGVRVTAGQRITPAFGRVEAQSDSCKPSCQAVSAPTPKPVAVAKPTPRIDPLQMVAVGDGRFCPVFVKGQRLKKWSKVGAHPYTGSLEYALSRFKGVPDEVKFAWRDMVKSGKAIDGTMEMGDVTCSMMYTVADDHKIWHHIKSAWKDKAPDGNPRTELVINTVTFSFDGFDWHLVIPPAKDGGCDNWNWWATKSST